jgi:hypothetical protein
MVFFFKNQGFALGEPKCLIFKVIFGVEKLHTGCLGG